MINADATPIANRSGKTGSGPIPVLPAVILAAIYVITGIVPLRSMWGLNHLQYYPTWAQLAFAILFILVLLPSTARSLVTVLSRMHAAYMNLPQWGRGLLIALVSATLFCLLRVHVHSLGDGYMRIFQVEKGVGTLHTEPLDFFLHVMLYKALNLFGSTGAESTYIIFSVLCGTAFCVIIGLITLPPPLDGNSGLVVKTLLLSLGGSQLFFGYVESYSLFYPAALLFILFSVKFLLSGHGMIPATLFFMIAASTHLTGVIYLPAFVVIAWINLKKADHPAEKIIPIILVLLVLTILGISELSTRAKYGEYIGSVGSLLLPVYATGYSMLSFSHLLDIINQLLLICPGAIIAFIPGCGGKDKTKNHQDLRIFLYISAILSLFFLLVIDPKLGYARDWDLFATPAGVLGLTIVLFVAIFGGLKNINSFRLVSIGAVSILFFSGWMLTNASTARQLARAEQLLAISDKGHGYCTELLAHYYRYDDEQPEKVVDLLNRITGPAKNARVHNVIARTELELERYPDALANARAGLAIDSTHTDLSFCAGRAYLVLGHPDSALRYLQAAFAREPGNYGYALNLARAFSRLEQWQHALVAFKAAIRAEPTYSASYFDIGFIYFHITQLDSVYNYDSSYYYIERGLRINPDYAEGYQMLEAIKSAASGAIGH